MEGRISTTPFLLLDHRLLLRVIRLIWAIERSRVCQAAPVSYGRGIEIVHNDEGLIRYLMRHWHSTPFRVCEIKAPRQNWPVLWSARQWILTDRQRKRIPARYSDLIAILHPRTPPM